MEDLCAIIEGLLRAEGLRRSADVAGRRSSVAELLAGLRGWLGLTGAGRTVSAWLVAGGGSVIWPGGSDIAALRTTSLRQMAHDVAGQPADPHSWLAWSQVLSAG
jgi:hypothetical protein